MPVVIKPQPEVVGKNADVTFTSARDILSAASTAWVGSKDIMAKGYFKELPRWGIVLANSNKPIVEEKRPIISSSFSANLEPIAVYGGGFSQSIIRAFEQDLHLVIRPDDLWQAILTQFSFFVVAHAEELRHFFVAHQGKKEVMLDIRPLSMEDLPPGLFARLMVNKMQEQIVDKELSDWFLPNFTTTTQTDIATASLTMMATMKQYFKFVMRGGCGFPSVTLLGERADWENILHRVNKLDMYGSETAEWGSLLTVVLQHILHCFDHPDSQESKDFWMCAVHQAGRLGSGDAVESISGWLTALCFWDEDGRRLVDLAGSTVSASLKAVLGPGQVPLVLGGLQFPLILPRIPTAAVRVNMSYQDYARSVQVDMELIAGNAGAEIKGEDCDTLQPRSGWWMLKDKEEPLTA